MTSLQVVLLLAAFAALIPCALLILRRPRYWGFMVGPITYLAHIIVKGITYWSIQPLQTQALKDIFNAWSAGIQLHGIIVILTLALIGTGTWKSGKRSFLP